MYRYMFESQLRRDLGEGGEKENDRITPHQYSRKDHEVIVSFLVWPSNWNWPYPREPIHILCRELSSGYELTSSSYLNHPLKEWSLWNSGHVKVLVISNRWARDEFPPVSVCVDRLEGPELEENREQFHRRFLERFAVDFILIILSHRELLSNGWKTFPPIEPWKTSLLFQTIQARIQMTKTVLLSLSGTYSLISRRSLVEREDCCFDSVYTAVAIDSHYLSRREHEDRHRSSIGAAYQYIRSRYRWYRTRLERFLDFSRRYCEQRSARQNWLQLTERRQG